VIGIRDSVGSLKEYGVTYKQVDLLEDGRFDYEGIERAINERTKLVTIQRSKGYQTRPTLSVERIGELIGFIKKINTLHARYLMMKEGRLGYKVVAATGTSGLSSDDTKIRNDMINYISKKGREAKKVAEGE